MAISQADLILAIGSRFDDRVTGKISEFAKHAKIVHIDIDPTSIQKNVPVDIPVVADCKSFLTSLRQILEPTLDAAGAAKLHAYVHPQRLGDVLTLEDVTLLAGQFVLRRGGTSLLAGWPALRRFYLHHGFALQMLLDLPKTVHLLSTLLASPLPPEDRPFVGLDCGAGTGILLLGQYLLARRSGWPDWRLTGFEHLPQVAERANLLLSRLGVGRVLLADATRPEVYREYAHDGDFPVIQAREHDDGNIWKPGVQARKSGQTRGIGQIEVEEHHIGPVLLEQGRALFKQGRMACASPHSASSQAPRDSPRRREAPSRAPWWWK